MIPTLIAVDYAYIIQFCQMENNRLGANGGHQNRGVLTCQTPK